MELEPFYSMNGALLSPTAQPLVPMPEVGFSGSVPRQVPHNRHTRTGSLSQVLNAEFKQGRATSHASESDSGLANQPQGAKRRRTDTSRAVTSYPRKRAVTACQLCRHRKTKCNNARPKCKICEDAGADCVYEDRADHSSFDPASILMLQKLNEVLGRLDAISPRQGDSSIDHSQHGAPDYALSSASQPPQAFNVPHEEYMRIPAFRTSPDKVLQWPIFEEKFEPECLVEKLFEAGYEKELDESLPDSQSWRRPANQKVSSNWHDDDIKRLIENFLLLVHIKNPILDVDTLKSYAMHVMEEGPGWDGRTCLVLLACALGALAKPFQSTLHLSTDESLYSTPDSLENCQEELDTAASYFAMARKRIGLLDGNIIRAQCFFLSGVYLMYILRPAEAWQNFHQASTTYHVYLKSKTKANNISETSLMRTRRLEQRLFWSCFKSECEIRIELSLPESSIASMNYPDMFPSPPTEEHDDAAVLSPNDSLASRSSSETFLDAGGRMMSFKNHNQQQSWYYYLSEIALRRIGNRLLNSFYKNDDYPGSGMTVPEMIDVARDFESQLSQWHAGLPELIRFNQSDFNVIPEEELPWVIQARQLDYMVWLTQPFLYYAIHHLPSDQYQDLIQPLVQKSLSYSISVITSRTIRHRHHGSFYGIRTGTVAALSILAAAKTSHILMPPNWKDAIQTQILTHKYWERESPDIVKARQILEMLLEEIEGPSSSIVSAERVCG